MYKFDLEIDLFRCINALIKRKMFVALIAVLFFVIGFGLTLDVGEDKYTSKATVYAASSGTIYDTTAAVNAMNAYLDVAKSYKVSQRAALIIGRGDVDAVTIQNALSVKASDKATGNSASITASSGADAIISFSATTTDPELSRQIADAAAESYVIEMANILKNDAVKNLDSASLGQLSSNANSEAWQRRVGFLFMGIILACLFIVFMEIFDNKVRTIRDATIRNQLPIIGIIPDYKE
ncbi:YveK family protein [Butyrivibrio sp. AE2032]|uniref:YveK family protein n=1 Tax=Butyrivibrio sp. AE2032 TaxID=1458463 RepID=UPI000552B42A|nr:Wzz/FepE/Etk N-terminal domain-containing protein [Butyrivibrio sp. AE2032]